MTRGLQTCSCLIYQAEMPNELGIYNYGVASPPFLRKGGDGFFVVTGVTTLHLFWTRLEHLLQPTLFIAVAVEQPNQ